MGIFKNSFLWRIFGHKREEVTGAWRKLHSEELHDMHNEECYCMHSSSNVTCVFRERQFRGACDTHGGGEKSICSCGEKI